MMIGYAEETITPPLGTPLSGFASRTSGCRCVESDLRCRCLSIQGSRSVFTIVVLDLLGVPLELGELVRKRVGAGDLVLVATHTHAGPDISRAPQSYVSSLVDRIATCILRSRELGISIEYVSSACTYLPQLVYNRRDPERGAVDPRLSLVVLENRERHIEAALLHFTCHAVVLGPNNLCVSPDWPGALARFVLSSGSIPRALVLNGCCGNINPYTWSTNPRDPYDRRGSSIDELNYFARALGYSALSLAEVRWREREEALDKAIVVTRSVELKLREEPIDVESLERRAREGDLYAKWLLERSLMVERLRQRFGSFVPVKIVCVALSRHVALLFLPSEVFVEHQLWITARSPFRRTVVVAYAEPYIGYIPTVEAFREGGYEASYPVSIVDPSSVEVLRRASLDAIHEAYALASSAP